MNSINRVQFLSINHNIFQYENEPKEKEKKINK